jgi:hypothetical protein
MAIGGLVLVVAPMGATYASIAGAHVGYQLQNWALPPSKIGLKQRETQCVSEPASIRVSGFLKLDGADDLGIRVQDLAVSYRPNDGLGFQAKLAEGQPGILASKSKYTWIDLVAIYDQADSDHAGPYSSECSLVLLKNVLPVYDDSVFDSSGAPWSGCLPFGGARR